MRIKMGVNVPDRPTVTTHTSVWGNTLTCAQGANLSLPNAGWF